MISGAEPITADQNTSAIIRALVSLLFPIIECESVFLCHGYVCVGRGFSDRRVNTEIAKVLAIGFEDIVDAFMGLLT